MHCLFPELYQQYILLMEKTSTLFYLGEHQLALESLLPDIQESFKASPDRTIWLLRLLKSPRTPWSVKSRVAPILQTDLNLRDAFPFYHALSIGLQYTIQDDASDTKQQVEFWSSFFDRVRASPQRDEWMNDAETLQMYLEMASSYCSLLRANGDDVKAFTQSDPYLHSLNDQSMSATEIVQEVPDPNTDAMTEPSAVTDTCAEGDAAVRRDALDQMRSIVKRWFMEIKSGQHDTKLLAALIFVFLLIQSKHRSQSIRGMLVSAVKDVWQTLTRAL